MPAAGDQNFASDLRIVFDDQNLSPALSHLDAAEKSRRTAADDDCVKFHLLKYLSRKIFI